MNWVDGVVIGLLVVSGLLGLLRGFVREALGLVAWSGAGLVALTTAPFLMGPMGRVVKDPQLAQICAYGLIFIITLIILSVIASAIGQMVRDSLLGSVDRSIGGIFGVVRGIALLVIAYMVMSAAIGPEDWPPAVHDAKSLPYIYKATVWSALHIPQDYRPRVDAPDAKSPNGEDQPLPLAPTLTVPGMMPPGMAPGAAPPNSDNVVPVPPPASTQTAP